MDKPLKKIESDLTKLQSTVEKPIQQLIQFVKDHKKLLLTLGVVYFVYTYLFGEDDE